MTCGPDPVAWQAYARDVAAAVRGARADTVSVDELKQRLEAAPAGVSLDVRCDILNLLYEEPANATAEDLADLNGVLDRLEAGAGYDEIVAYLAYLWG